MAELAIFGAHVADLLFLLNGIVDVPEVGEETVKHLVLGEYLADGVVGREVRPQQRELVAENGRESIHE